MFLNHVIETLSVVSKFDCWSEGEGRVKKLELGPGFPAAEGVGGTYL